jgi:hypothetical protein
VRSSRALSIALSLVCAFPALIAFGYIFRFREIHHPFTTAFAAISLVAVAILARQPIARALDALPFRRALLTIFLAALLLRLGWVFAADTVPVSDFQGYLDLARGTVESGVYGFGGVPSNKRPPGFPAVLMLFELLRLDPIRGGQLVNAIASSATIFPIARFTRAVGAPRSCSLFAAIIWTMMPSAIFMTSVLATEPLFALLVSAAAALLVERRYALAGIAAGLGTYVRPQAILVPLAIGLVAATLAESGTRKRLIAGHALAFLVTIALLVPWGIRNASTFDTFALLTFGGGGSAYIGNNPKADGRHLDLEEWPDRIDSEDERERDRILYRKAFEWISHHPADFIALIPKKWIHLFKSEHDTVLWSHTGSRSAAYAPLSHAAAQIYYVAILALAAIGALALRRRVVDITALGAGLALFACWYAQHAFYHAQPRYHAALTPFFCALASLVAWTMEGEHSAHDPFHSRMK